MSIARASPLSLEMQKKIIRGMTRVIGSRQRGANLLPYNTSEAESLFSIVAVLLNSL